MLTYKIRKDICLMDGTKVDISINIPIEEKYTSEQEDEFIESMIIDQLMRGFNTGKEAYEASELPNKFLNYSKFHISNQLEYPILGIHHGDTHDISFDSNAISGIGVSPDYLFGHELGHKISKFIDRKQAFKDIADILMMSDAYQYYLEEIFANECGNMVSGEENNEFYDQPLPEAKRKGIQRRILANVYRI